MKCLHVTVRDLCWIIVVFACLCSGLRERRHREEISRENDKIAGQRNFWIQRASEVQSAAAREEWRLKYYEGGISFLRYPQAERGRFHHDIPFDQLPDPEQITGPEILPVVP